MVFNPAIIALIMGSLFIGAAMLMACALGLRIIRRFDLRSGSPGQLVLERQTYLLSTVLSYTMAFQLLSLFLFIYLGEDLHGLFVGAMCAAGTFNVNDFGYPTLVLKCVNTIGCGIWLVLNHADNQAEDYPLIRVKYKMLLPLACLLFLEGALQLGFFGAMRPNVITSCCGTLFSEEASTVAGSLAHLPLRATQILFFLNVLLAIRACAGFLYTGRGAMACSVLNLLLLATAVIGVISFISVWYYELPSHHCPFCILKPEYHSIGYPLYAAILAVGVAGGAMGLLDRYRNIPSLGRVVPGIQRKLAILALGCALALGIIAAYPMLVSDFKPYEQVTP